MKIGARLGLSFGVLSVLLLATATLGVMRLAALNTQMNDVIHDKYPKTVLANDVIKNVNIIARASRSILLMSDPEQIEGEYAAIEKAGKNTRASLEKLDQMIVSAKGRELLKAVLDARTAFNVGRDEVLRLEHEGSKEEAVKLLLASVRALQHTYLDALEELIVYQDQLMEASGADVRAEYSNARDWMFGLSGLAVLLSVAIAVLATRSIVRPLKHAVMIAQTVAAGDLTLRFESRSTDETGILLQALAVMNASLLNIVNQVRAGTDTIATASTQIAAGNLDLAARTEEQASSLEETASAMEQLTSTVQQNAANAGQANQLAVSASDIALQGGRVVGHVIVTMESISSSSAQIAEIIGVIDSIAFQTNILALNAAVEAARAGEQGRGFAVVASEVRTLAQRSAAAAKEIKALIDNSVQQVDSGTKLVTQAGKTMQEVVQAVERVNQMVSDITTASREQGAGIEQISQAVVQMDQVTQQNAALVEEGSAASQSLREEAAKLLEIVSVFKISQASAESREPARLAAPGRLKRLAAPVAAADHVDD
ncbi:HAMP domain protein [Janthinobacterium agaricidamnosum NBRC 102515 = DSM 9628]|uniref:HAMP domain protein n=2 Tax=Janthinobacterium agaricidamnosum TaxID=55508 RepID=W0V607_9BURK|nr:HAMP domain protein [Janthinobacterium agaricidamnosum NBRC 102515 = DSM 9628]